MLLFWKKQIKMQQAKLLIRDFFFFSNRFYGFVRKEAGQGRVEMGRVVIKQGAHGEEEKRTLAPQWQAGG